MSRFIVRFRGSAPAKEITARLRAGPVKILEETARMVLVEADESELLKLIQPGPDVVIVPEHHYEQPDSLPSIRQDPSKR